MPSRERLPRFIIGPLEPNFAHYWQPDSDAVNSMDSYEAYIWFLSRGDECLNCDGGIGELLQVRRWPMIIRVRKNRGEG